MKTEKDIKELEDKIRGNEKQKQINAKYKKLRMKLKYPLIYKIFHRED